MLSFNGVNLVVTLLQLIFLKYHLGQTFLATMKFNWPTLRLLSILSSQFFLLDFVTLGLLSYVSLEQSYFLNSHLTIFVD